MDIESKEQTPRPELAPVILNENTNIRLGNDPNSATEEAIETAKFLKKMVIDKKEGIKSESGKRYIEFTEWQTLGNFYKVSVRTEILEYEGKGIHLVVKARGIATYIPTGQCVGSAEAFCSKSEKGKGKHSLNQIASMAQTRAGSKAMRNALGWVVELAGMCSTPAEEMDGIINNDDTPERTQQAPPTTQKKVVNKPKSSKPKSSKPTIAHTFKEPENTESEPPETKEPDNVQDAVLTGPDYWKQLATENKDLQKVITYMDKQEFDIFKENIIRSTNDLLGDMFTPEQHKNLLDFLEDKEDQ